MIKIITGAILLLIACRDISAQPETEIWGGKEYDYSFAQHRQRDYSLKNETATSVLPKLFLMGYWLFISDADGDKCRFEPSCSSFMAQSIRKYGIFYGVLMGADRLLRDTNTLNDIRNYTIIKNNRYYDPPEKYAP